MKSNNQNKPFLWATTFLRELHTMGVKHLVISPGSRSTPLVLAAASHGGLQKHVVLDERSAAYIALGIGKASGEPAALICTSGTAVANYYPAVIESRQSGVPLIVLSADRPPYLRNIGAPQAIDQIKIFGDYPVFFHEAGEPVLEDEDLKRLQRVAVQAVKTTKTRMGPAHVNFPFRKPLEPEQEIWERSATENQKLDRKSSVEIVETSHFQIPGDLLKEFFGFEKPVVIVGPLSPSADTKLTIDLAKILNAPLISEMGSGGSSNSVRGFGGFLRNSKNRQSLEPDLILRFGSFPASKGLQLALEGWKPDKHIHFSDTENWSDQCFSVTHRIDWNGRKASVSDIPQKTNGQWLNNWKSTEKSFIDYSNSQINQIQQLTDGHVFYELSQKIPAEWNVFLSNSFPVRDMQIFGRLDSRSVFVNRGASGIDGILSTALGATLAGQKPGILFIGDLAVLHDSNAFLSNTLLKQPLIVILLNNGGGNIFRMLPIFEHPEVYTDYFETPQQADFSKLAEMHEIGYESISTVEQLQKINPGSFSNPGIHLVECKTDSDASMDLRHKLWNFSA